MQPSLLRRRPLGENEIAGNEKMHLFLSEEPAQGSNKDMVWRS